METAALLRLIADETRHRLLRRLRDGPATVGALVETVGQEQSNVSHHLRLLRDAGVVQAGRDGRHRVYRLADPEVGHILGRLDAAAARLDHVAYTSALGIPVDAAFHGYG